MSERTSTRTPTAQPGPAPEAGTDGSMLRYAQEEIALLEHLVATNDDEVDTAVIPRLAAPTMLVPVQITPRVELAPAAAGAAVTPSSRPVLAEPVTPPVQATPPTRHRHASTASLVAVRRNQLALCVVVVATILLGALAGIVGGWVAVAGYAFVVGAILIGRTMANSRHTPRHGRHTPRHA